MKRPTIISRTLPPKGFHWKIDDSGIYNVYINLANNITGHHIGYIQLSRVNSKPPYKFETHSHLDTQYHGKGWGTKLYARAVQWCLQHGYRVKSSGASSSMARRVWESKGLRQKFAIRKKKNELNSAYDTWYAYAKPIPLNKKKIAVGKKKAISGYRKR